MATLALKPAFPIRTKSGSKRSRLKQHARSALQSRPWRTAAVAAGAFALTFFSVSAPMVDDPAAHLFALDAASTIPPEASLGREAWLAQAFEFTPTMLGPAITADALALAELALAEEEGTIVVMPELEVHARPPAEDDALAPPG